MKGIILYSSQYGATKRYADWLAEETGFDCVETKRARIEDVRQYDAVILGGGVYASGIKGLGFLEKNIAQLSGKRIVVFCDGVSPYDEAAFRQLVGQNMKGALAGVPCFYCRGAFDRERLHFMDRNLCRLLHKAVSKLEPGARSGWQEALLEAWEEKRDWTDRAYLAPIIDAIGADPRRA